MRIAERITSKGAAYPYIVPQYATHRLKVPLPNNRLSVHFDECIFPIGELFVEVLFIIYTLMSYEKG